MTKQGITEQLLENRGLIYYTLDLLGCKYSDEAIAVGNEALWRACVSFDETKNIQFSTYAVTCIKHAIWDMYRTQQEINAHECFLEDLHVEPGAWDTNIDESSQQDTFYLMQEAIASVLKKLPSLKKKIAITWLASLRGPSDIALEVGCSQSYASQTISQVKHLIRGELLNAGYRPKFIEDTSDQ